MLKGLLKGRHCELGAASLHGPKGVIRVHRPLHHPSGEADVLKLSDFDGVLAFQRDATFIRRAALLNADAAEMSASLAACVEGTVGAIFAANWKDAEGNFADVTSSINNENHHAGWGLSVPFSSLALGLECLGATRCSCAYTLARSL